MVKPADGAPPSPPADPRAAWAYPPLPGPARTGPRPQPGPWPRPDRPGAAGAPPPAAQDTLAGPDAAGRWADLVRALDAARVPLAVGDTDALRRAAKIDPELLDTLLRWIRTANAPRDGAV
ncbi:hypothetical protein [Kitasatospora sp. NPDC088346]|uniref:hypothetical protein n=1 Tax=Kitasatospora sp. NPDC088346 TaxID=3364073 RepID=UPI00380FA47A